MYLRIMRTKILSSPIQFTALEYVPNSMCTHPSNLLLLACTTQLHERRVQDLLAMATLRNALSAREKLDIIASIEKDEKHHHCLA